MLSSAPRSGPCPRSPRRAPRRRAVSAALGAWLAAGLLACASSAPGPHANLAPLWKDFLALPEQRAMAVAGDPRRGPWVSGISAGQPTQAAAQAAALAECGERRKLRRLQAPCRLYGVGAKIVWRD